MYGCLDFSKKTFLIRYVVGSDFGISTTNFFYWKIMLRFFYGNKKIKNYELKHLSSNL